MTKRTPPSWIVNDIDDHRRQYYLQRWLATPPWLSNEDRKKIRDTYEVASRRHQSVNHIVPLSSPIVCGLHVPWNLEIIPLPSNIIKSNHMWPGHPCEPHPLFIELPDELFNYQLGLF